MTTTAPSTDPPPAWFLDPSGQAMWRWWDGHAWTAHVHGTPPASTPRPLPPPPPPRDQSGGLLSEIGQTFFGAFGSASDAAATARQGRGRFRAEPDEVPPAARPHPGGPWVAIALVAGVAVSAGMVLIAIPTHEENSPDINVGEFFHWLPLILAVGLTVVGVYLWRRYWLLVDTPTIEVAGAYPGLVEVTGRAQFADPPVPGWFTHAPCVWYEARVERFKKAGKGYKWLTEWKHREGSERFYLTDPTGRVLVEPPTGMRGRRRLLRHKIASNLRYVEEGLMVGDWLYVLGPVVVAPTGELVVRRTSGVKDGRLFRPPLWVAQSHEEKVVQRLRWCAVAATAVALAAAVVFTATETVAGDHPDYDTEVVVRDGRVLASVLVVVAVLVALALASYFLRLFNRFVALKHQAAFAWSLIDTSVVLRSDTIGRLVDAVGEAADHERTTQVGVGAGPGGLPTPRQAGDVERTVSADTAERTQIVARSEAYPDLKAQPDFQQLFRALVAVENRIAAHRRFYNDAVTVLADQTGTFPGILLRRLVLGSARPMLLRLDLGEAPAQPLGAG